MQKHVVRQILFSPAHKPTFCLKVKEPRHHIYSLPRGEILLRNITFTANEKNSKCKSQFLKSVSQKCLEIKLPHSNWEEYSIDIFYC